MDKHAKNGALLNLNACVRQLHGAVHAGIVESDDDGPQGQTFAYRVVEHLARIETALKDYREALAYYREVHTDG